MDDFAIHLRSLGYRLTPQRLAILGILRDAGGHLLPVEVFRQAQQVIPGLTEATVYRTLSFLTDQGLVLAGHNRNGQPVYEIAEHNHHHLICRVCGQTQEIDHSALQTLYEQFQASTGYQIDSVHVTFYGLCPNCQQSKNSSRKP
ncbi:MAG TPA: Fur family transcriptional regulator [Anaerolineales bacterium]